VPGVQVVGKNPLGVLHCVSSRLSKKTPRPVAATSVVVVLLLALVRVGAAILADTMLTLWSLIADIICLRLRTFIALVNRSNQLYAHKKGVRAPKECVSFLPNHTLRNIRTGATGFCSRNRFHK
jgi:hypothetical protein